MIRYFSETVKSYSLLIWASRLETPGNVGFGKTLEGSKGHSSSGNDIATVQFVAVDKRVCSNTGAPP